VLKDEGLPGPHRPELEETRTKFGSVRWGRDDRVGRSPAVVEFPASVCRA